jgi:hypothetical protein
MISFSRIADDHPAFGNYGYPRGRDGMKIVDIEMIELRVPGRTGGTFDGSYDNCLVLVHTDEGLSGIMEVDSVPPVIRDAAALADHKEEFPISGDGRINVSAHRAWRPRPWDGREIPGGMIGAIFAPLQKRACSGRVGRWLPGLSWEARWRARRFLAKLHMPRQRLVRQRGADRHDVAPLISGHLLDFLQSLQKC